MNNNYAFIDGQNLHFGVKSLGWKLDHKKFRKYLEQEHNVSKAYIFLGFMEEHQDLYNVLQEAGFICFFKPLVRYEDGTIKGNVDADLVLQAMIDIDRYDNAVIVTGDGDFSGLLRHLMTIHKLGQVIIPNRDKYSSLFDRLEGFDKRNVTYMNDLKSKLQYVIHKKPRPNQQNSQNRQQNNRTPQNSRNQPSSTKPASVKPQQTRNLSQKPQSTFKPKSAIERSLLDAIDKVA